MKNTKFIAAVMLAFTLDASAAEKIVGGERVTSLQDAPYFVSLSGSCGGSIISNQWVLTAAHCAGYFSEAKGGILNLKEQGHKFKVKRVIKHPKYNGSTFSHDFALVELTEKIDFKKTNLQAVKLATPKFAEDGHVTAGADATVYGFGNLGSYQSNAKGDFYKVIVPMVSNEEANKKEAYDGAIDETMLPAGYAAGGKDSCQGDSGGPLVVFDEHNEAVQVGVVSWGEGCALQNKYGIYSRVSVGHSWIKTTAGLK